MAKRRRSGRNSKQHKLPKAAETVAFTEADEAFFSAGDSLAETHIEHEEHGERKPSFWRRLFSSAA
jgi:hypothetical protein